MRKIHGFSFTVVTLNLKFIQILKISQNSKLLFQVEYFSLIADFEGLEVLGSDMNFTLSVTTSLNLIFKMISRSNFFFFQFEPPFFTAKDILRLQYSDRMAEKFIGNASTGLNLYLLTNRITFYCAFCR